MCVIDCRAHVGGNCHDYRSEGTLIHAYGPHVFHCPSRRIISFLDTFTQWIPYVHTVTAEIARGEALRYVPFPYCNQTIQALGQMLSEQDVIDSFFRGYSQKMWGMAWEELPLSIRGRVPRVLTETPVYYKDPFVALPKLGYTHMLENMFDGVELILGAPPLEWTKIQAASIVYTGRPDLIPVPSERVSLGERYGLSLDFRTLDIRFETDAWAYDSSCLHACSVQRNWTRKTCFQKMTGGESQVISTEFPRQAEFHELNPFYPIEVPANQQRFLELKERVRQSYPHLHLAGRLGSYRYFDMYQAVGQALTLATVVMGQSPSDLAAAER